MNNTLKNLIYIIIGIVVGAIVNGALVNIGYKIIPPPPGFDLSKTEGFNNAIKLFEAKNFIFPFLAHAFGTFIGAFIVAYFSSKNNLIYALIIALVFFLGGLSMVLMVKSPVWFTILDLVGAYFPFAFLGYKLAALKKDN
jgi:hypothetical protein